MKPENRSAAVSRLPKGDAPETDQQPPQTDSGTAPITAAEALTLDPLELRIQQKEAEFQAAMEAGQHMKAERIAQFVAKLKQNKAERDQARADQKLLERADAGEVEDKAADEGGKPTAAPEARADAEKPEVLPPAALSQTRGRHWAVMLSFVVLVLIPTAVAGWYLWNRATDRFISRAGFSVRTEEIGSAIELLGGVANLSGSSSSDPTILYAFIKSQEMVALVDKELDLRAIWAKADPEIDPIFAYHPPGTIEDMVDYWSRRVKVYNDDSGLIDLEVQAFTADDAREIARVIYEQSSKMINRLSAIAREDGTSYARDELATAVEQLRQARVAMTQFRNRTQIVDPSASLQSQMGILASLQQQLAETLIDLDILRQQAVSETDPRIVQGERRLEVINDRIEEERRKLGIGTNDSGSSSSTNDPNAFASLIGEYESLQVDLQFAQESYTAARAAYDASIATARRQSRYLAAHVTPTLPERAELPERGTLLALVALFSFLTWAMIVLTSYAMRDRN